MRSTAFAPGVPGLTITDSACSFSWMRVSFSGATSYAYVAERIMDAEYLWRVPSKQVCTDKDPN